MSAPRLSVSNLEVSTDTGIHLVDGLSFELRAGEILGLVGESGSGKTMACRALMRLLPGARLAITGGAVRLDGRDLVRLPEREMCAVRGREIGMIFQNPASHIDPIMRIGNQIAEAIRLHEGASRREARRAAVEALRRVGIPDPESRSRSHAHEFSGGMRQRAMIALALACRPSVLIADEPTTALDVTVQAQVLRLLMHLRDTEGVSILLVTHDLGVVAQTCDSVAVMYAGRLCEKASTRALLEKPLHHYAAGLIRCQPLSEGVGPLDTIAGQPPALDALPPGCRFEPRCPGASALCHEHLPELHDHRAGRGVACHHPLDGSAVERPS